VYLSREGLYKNEKKWWRWVMVEIMNEYFSANETAMALGISKQTLLRYEKKKIFPRAKRNLINKRREYTAGDIESLKRIIGRR
jgi:transcriptional regulator with XRE-family HTH domain